MNRLSKLWTGQEPEYDTTPGTEMNPAPRSQDGINISINNVTTKYPSQSFGKIIATVLVTFFSVLFLLNFSVPSAFSSLTTSPTFPYITTHDARPKVIMTHDWEFIVAPHDGTYNDELGESDELKSDAKSDESEEGRQTNTPDNGTTAVSSSDTTLFVTIAPPQDSSPSPLLLTGSSPRLVAFYSSSPTTVLSASSMSDSSTYTGGFSTPASPNLTSPGSTWSTVTIVYSPSSSSSTLPTASGDSTTLPAPSLTSFFLPTTTICTTTYKYTRPTQAFPTDSVLTWYASTKTGTISLNCGTCENLHVDIDPTSNLWGTHSFTSITYVDLATSIVSFTCATTSSAQVFKEPTFTTIPTPTLTLTVTF
ncbi:Fc.00g085340.m01.CDS01 [Cosmosporella sp. VM-42]